VVKIRVKELAETAGLLHDVTQRLEQHLLQMEQRTYLWLYLAMNDIRSTFENSLRPAEESIRMIPPSVNEAYERILSRVASVQMDTVRKILQIIVAARRPLTIAEMAMALGIAISPQSRTAGEAGLDSSRIDKKLRRLCGLFVFINNSKVYLIHQTAREFLIAKSSSDNFGLTYSWRLSDPEDQMARICLRYLLMEDLVGDENRLYSSTQDFLDYSAIYWPDHVRKMELASDQEAVDQVHRLYDMSGKLFSLWFPIFWEAARPREGLPTMKALHLAAFNGHKQEVRALLDVQKRYVNKRDGTRTYAIIWASLNGHEKVVQLLLDHRAHVNAQGGYYGNALYAACSKGHKRIVQVLLDHGADVNAQGGKYGNALYAVCYKGHKEIVQLLLDHRADVNAQDREHRTALQAAYSIGHDKIVRLLLERGAHVNAQGGQYGNALQAACSIGHDKIVWLLLERGADINAQGGHYGNALQAACSEGHNETVQLLVERGADVNAQGGHGGTGLQAACSNGHDKIIQLLLEHRADINA
jgi:ankyrin repeat protein